MSPDGQSSSPAAGAVAIQPAASASQPAHEIMALWRAAFADSPEPEAADSKPDVSSVSNGDTPPSPPASAVPTSDPQPAPSPDEGVKASDAPGPDSEPDPSKPPSRREAERIEHEKTISELRAQLAERDPETLKLTLRDEILAEEAQRAAQTHFVEQSRADAARFDVACRLLDGDPRLDEPVPGDPKQRSLYQWREDRKDLIDRYPEAAAAIQSDADRRIAIAIEHAERVKTDGWLAIQDDLSAQIAASERLPGVDAKAFEAAGTTWKDMAEQIHAAGAAWKAAELSERVTKAEADAAHLREENKALREEALGDRRAPAVIGRTAGAASTGDVFDPSLGWRGNLVGAVTPNGSG